MKALALAALAAAAAAASSPSYASAAAATPSATVTLVSPSATVTLVSPTPIGTTNAQYASWNIDSSCNRGFHHTNFSNPNLRVSARALTPSRLRFGGSGNDNLVYGLSEGSPECAAVPPPDPSTCSYTTPGCLNATHWQDLYGFGVAAEADFMFGVAFGLEAACAQGPKYVWNSTNFNQLLGHIIANNQTGNLWGFEMGNEINNNGPSTSCKLEARQQAAALLVLAGMVSAVSSSFPAPPFLIGPDSGGLYPLTWLEGFLPLAAPVVQAVTHHVYNGIDRTNYNSPRQFDSPLPEIAWYKNVTRVLAPKAEVWAGENGPTGGGNDGTCGAEACCGTFATTMWYADDLALRATHGFVQHQRHDFFGGAYGLTNSPTGAMALGPTDPVILRPDFYTNFLWKRTVGTSVLNVTSSSPLVRAYAFAGTPPSPFAAAECAGSALQLVLINLDNSSSTTAVALPPAAGQYAAWSLTALAGQPEGPFTLLSAINGQATEVTVDVTKGDPSAFLSGIVQPPVQGAVGDGAVLPPLSTTFLCYQ